MTIKVIGAGFGRTGTMSMKAALERLGFDPCHHMSEVIANPKQAATWLAAARGEAIDWRTFLADYQATIDWPSCTYYRELMDVYPDAKVVLNVRDPASWYESVRTTIYTLTTTAPSYLTRLAPPVGAVVNVGEATVWEGTFKSRFLDKAYATAIFRAHIEDVKRVVPPERLLVFSVKEGWEPLCQFLGVPVPKEPFPHLNDRAEMQARIRVLRRVKMGVRVAGALALGALAAAIFRREPPW